METSKSGPGRRRILDAAILGGALSAVAFVVFSWGRVLLTRRSFDGAGEVILGIVTDWILATAVFAPFLLAVLIAVAGPSRRAVAGGAVLVYVFDLLLTIGQTVLYYSPVGMELVVLAVPLTSVVTFLAVATAMWLAYHGGYERLVSAAGPMEQHPVFAMVADKEIRPALSLQRGLIVAGFAATVGAGGLVLAGGIGNFLRTVARSGTGGVAITVLPHAQVWNVGVSLERFPIEWLFEASFLLGVLLVTGSRLRFRDLFTGIAVVFAVQSTVLLLSALIPPFHPVDLWDASGPILTPLSDAILLFGIAVAVKLAFHDGLETLYSGIRTTLVSD